MVPKLFNANQGRQARLAAKVVTDVQFRKQIAGKFWKNFFLLIFLIIFMFFHMKAQIRLWEILTCCSENILHLKVE